MILKNKSLTGFNILVSAGSTWVSIDTVRVITNIFKGKIGLTIAEAAAQHGANVTLLLGPSMDVSSLKLPVNINVIRFKYFDELDLLMKNALISQKFDAVVHSAAVSDFKLKKVHIGKIKSNTNNLILRLIPTKKIVDDIKKYAPNVFLIKFKLEVGVTVEKLTSIAFNSLQKSNADLIVANIYDSKFTDHEAYIIDKQNIIEKATGKKKIAEKILRHIYEKT
ncbi:MAG: phosphopantothenoylcysteine decarboxylase [Candidatus Paceibacterota bacterium]